MSDWVIAALCNVDGRTWTRWRQANEVPRPQAPVVAGLLDVQPLHERDFISGETAAGAVRAQLSRVDQELSRLREQLGANGNTPDNSPAPRPAAVRSPSRSAGP